MRIGDQQLKGKKIAFLATHMVEEVELTRPWDAVKKAGGTPQLLSMKRGEIPSSTGGSSRRAVTGYGRRPARVLLEARRGVRGRTSRAAAREGFREVTARATR